MMQSGQSGHGHDPTCGAATSSEVFKFIVVVDDGFMASARP